MNGGLNNDGIATNSGTVNGGVNNGGLATNSGTVNDGLTNGGGYTQTGGSTNGGTTNTGTINATGGAFTGPIANNAGTFTVNGTVTADNTFTNANAATLSVAGGSFTGITTLTNDSTAAVGINVSSGATLSSNALAGTTAASVTQVNGALNTGATSSSYAGRITGSGTVNKIGAGTLTLSGNSAAYAGTTNVNGGTLRVDGSLGGTMNVGTNGTAGRLEGTGSVSTLGSTTRIGDNGTLAAGGTSAGTLNVAGDLTMASGAVSEFQLGTANVVGGATNDLVTVGGDLSVAGTLSLSNGSGGSVVSGYYTLFDVTGTSSGAYSTITNNGTNATADVTQIRTNPNSLTGSSEFNILLANGGQRVQFWDGSNQSADNTVSGGNGTWNASNTNWTTVDGAINDQWRSQVGYFGGAAGTVTVSGTQNVQGLQFATDGYTLTGGTINATGNPFGNASASFINTNAATTTTIASTIAGNAGIDKLGSGTLILAGNNTYTGTTTVSGGVLTIASGGSVASGVVNNAGFNNNGTVGGSLTNNAGAVATNSGTVSGGLANLGTYTQTAGTTNGGTSNTGTINARSAFSGAIANYAGTFNVTGDLTANATFSNLNSAVLNVSDGNFTGMTTLANASTVNIGTSRRLSADVINNSGVINLQGAGSTLFGTANTTNNFGTINVANGGAVIDNGAINNLSTGVFNFAGSATFDSDINNNGTGQIVNEGVINLNGADGSVVDVAGSAASGAGSNNDIVNRNNARLNVNASDLINVETLTNSSSGGDGAGGTAGVTIGSGGLLSASAVNNSGEFSSIGTVATTNGFANSGTASVRGALNGPVSNSGTFGLTGNLSGNGSFTNSGLYTGNGFSHSGLTAFSNTGTVLNNGGSITAGTYTNAGTIDLGRNNTVQDTYTINGNLVSQSGQYNVDIDLGRNNTNGEQLADRIVVNGDLSGTGTVNFDQQNTTFTLQDNPITVVDVAGANSASFTATGLPQAGSLIEYDLVKVGNDFAVVSSVNPGVGGVAGNVVLVQSLISTVINRPSTPFVSSLIADAEPSSCNPGAWVRGTGGQGSAEGSTTNQIGRTIGASIDLDYWGIQGGVDYNCLPAEELGVDFSMGLTAGYNEGDTSQDLVSNGAVTSITRTDFEQYYFGGYIAGSKPIGEGVLAGDLQFRYGSTDFVFNNVAAPGSTETLGLVNSLLESERATFSGSLSYAYPLPYDMSVVPAVGFSYDKTFSGPLTFRNNGIVSTLEIDDFETFIGFGGATLAKTFIDEVNTVAYRPFITATAYNDFSGDVGSTLSSSGASQRLSSENIGTFGEVSLGLDTIKLFDGGFGPVKQLNANIRGDAKFSDRVETYSLTGQIRLNF